MRYGVYGGSILLCIDTTRSVVCLLFVVSTFRALLLSFRRSISRVCHYSQGECSSHQECSFLSDLFERDLVVHSNPF